MRRPAIFDRWMADLIQKRCSFLSRGWGNATISIDRAACVRILEANRLFKLLVYPRHKVFLVSFCVIFRASVWSLFSHHTSQACRCLCKISDSWSQSIKDKQAVPVKLHVRRQYSSSIYYCCTPWRKAGSCCRSTSRYGTFKYSYQLVV